MDKSDFGLIGLAVMGENLVLNIIQNGYTVSVYNRTVSKVDDFIQGRAKGKKVTGFKNIPDFVASLIKPRKIMMLVKAGSPVDNFIDQLLPFLEKGDLIIDGGNSHFQDTIRRAEKIENKELLYIGTGVSGGEEGALKGPSLMPGGSSEAWFLIKPIFHAIAAKVDNNIPCCDWIGSNGAGHFVKMVHNGIEYGDMQMIGEAYNIMKTGLGMKTQEMQGVFSSWNENDLNSYLIGITAEIMGVKDEDTNEPVLDLILDAAGQKGTGRWTSETALSLGIPAQTIAEAVFARAMSALKDERVAAAGVLKGPVASLNVRKEPFIKQIHNTLFASKICSYAQGFQLMRAAAEEYGWKLNYGKIAKIWRGGCIIRAQFLDKIIKAYANNPALPNLLLDNYFKGIIESCQNDWREVVAAAAMNGIPVPAFSSALAYYDSYRSAVLPANLIQAQRDYFGAHTYERIDRPRGKFHHTNWTGKGGKTISSTYIV